LTTVDARPWRNSLWLAAGVFAAVHLFSYLWPAFFDTWNERLNDFYFGLKTSIPAFAPPYDEAVVHVDLNNTSLRALKDYHPTRAHYARVINNLGEMKVALQMCDIIFAGETNAEGTALDWALGESLAWASLLVEGSPVRLSGQDSVRGTFSHRHAGLTIEDSAERWFPLQHVAAGQARFEALNSPLNEYGVLGFEYGHSSAAPGALTVWEAQFGDFANGAQVVFDQFLSCGEAKWGQHSGLVVLLPHGYEGQGHEHSSARIERFLQLAAGINLQLANVTAPANLFHLFRRQLARPFRKPLVVFTPKSLLRHPRCVSPLADFGPGTRFEEVLADGDPARCERVVLCSGKLYYELLERREAEGREDVALLRLEQLAPLPVWRLQELRERYARAERWIWVQEEPENMGAWRWLQAKWPFGALEGVHRKEAAATATGISRRHKAEQKRIVDQAFA